MRICSTAVQPVQNTYCNMKHVDKKPRLECFEKKVMNLGAVILNLVHERALLSSKKLSTRVMSVKDNTRAMV